VFIRPHYSPPSICLFPLTVEDTSESSKSRERDGDDHRTTLESTARRSGRHVAVVERGVEKAEEGKEESWRRGKQGQSEVLRGVRPRE
jgi:hypothetical protein